MVLFALAYRLNYIDREIYSSGSVNLHDCELVDLYAEEFCCIVKMILACAKYSLLYYQLTGSVKVNGLEFS